jgi:hypothetical protein
MGTNSTRAAGTEELLLGAMIAGTAGTAPVKRLSRWHFTGTWRPALFDALVRSTQPLSLDALARETGVPRRVLLDLAIDGAGVFAIYCYDLCDVIVGAYQRRVVRLHRELLDQLLSEPDYRFNDIFASIVENEAFVRLREAFDTDTCELPEPRRAA